MLVDVGPASTNKARHERTTLAVGDLIPHLRAMDGSFRARPRLSVVLPARDEEANIEQVVSTVFARTSAHVSALEIIVVNDGSRDRTASRIEELAALRPEIRVVTHDQPRGYGAALRSGFAVARYEWVFVTDADGQFPLVELPAALDAIELHDRVEAVMGYRAARADGVARGVLGRSWTLIADNALGVRARDVNCAFKLFPRRVVVAPALSSDGAAISAEIWRRLGDASLVVREVPVTHRPRRAGKQRGARVSVALQAVVELAQLAWSGRRETSGV